MAEPIATNFSIVLKMCFVREKVKMNFKLLLLLVMALPLNLLGDRMSDDKKRYSPVEVPNGDKDGRLVMTLMSSRKEEKGGHKDFQLRLKITNKEGTWVNLDGRLLTPVIMTRIIDGSGKVVNRLSPPVPNSLERQSLVQIRPKAPLNVYFYTSEVTSDRLSNPPYKITCCYDPQNVDYPRHLRVWNHKICSNELEIQ